MQGRGGREGSWTGWGRFILACGRLCLCPGYSRAVLILSWLSCVQHVRELMLSPFSFVCCFFFAKQVMRRRGGGRGGGAVNFIEQVFECVVPLAVYTARG